MALLATLTGFGSIIGIFIRSSAGTTASAPTVSSLRCSPWALQQKSWLTQRTGKARAAFAAVLAVLLVFGFWEQQGLYNPEYEIRTGDLAAGRGLLWLRSSRRQGRTL